MSDKPVFSIKKNNLTRSVGSFRVTDQMANAIDELQAEYRLPQCDIVRQMIQFALDHMERKPKAEVFKGEGK